jgi:hypothetical protein
MFLNYIKDFLIKKRLKNNLHKVKNEAFTSNVQTIGLLIDESDFQQSEALVKELILQGISSDKLKIVVYSNKFKEKESYLRPTFGKKHINWQGELKESFLTEFVAMELDLLISYYDVEKAILMTVTNESKAKFKVGFASVGLDLNRWVINSVKEDYKLFVFELFKYLKNIK